MSDGCWTNIELQAPVASFQGGLLTSQGEARKAAWELFEHRLEALPRTRAFRPSSSPATSTVRSVRPMSNELAQSLVQVAQAAGRRQLRVALEFQARAALGNNLQTAVALIDEVGSPHLGICLDVFQFYLGPSKLADLALLNSPKPISCSTGRLGGRAARICHRLGSNPAWRRGFPARAADRSSAPHRLPAVCGDRADEPSDLAGPAAAVR